MASSSAPPLVGQWYTGKDGGLFRMIWHILANFGVEEAAIRSFLHDFTRRSELTRVYIAALYIEVFSI
jgi:hypothetical protein